MAAKKDFTQIALDVVRRATGEAPATTPKPKRRAVSDKLDTTKKPRKKAT